MEGNKKKITTRNSVNKKYINFKENVNVFFAADVRDQLYH